MLFLWLPAAVPPADRRRDFPPAVSVCVLRGRSHTRGGGGFRFLLGRSHSERQRNVKLKDQRGCHSNQDHHQPINTQSGGPSCI